MKLVSPGPSIPQMHAYRTLATTTGPRTEPIANSSPARHACLPMCFPYWPASAYTHRGPTNGHHSGSWTRIRALGWMHRFPISSIGNLEEPVPIQQSWLQRSERDGHFATKLARWGKHGKEIRKISVYSWWLHETPFLRSNFTFCIKMSWKSLVPPLVYLTWI